MTPRQPGHSLPAPKDAPGPRPGKEQVKNGSCGHAWSRASIKAGQASEGNAPAEGRPTGAEHLNALWAFGNYPAIARGLEPAARALVEACAVAEGYLVLDVAAGNGNVAVESARRAARVTALDIAPSMVQLGRARAAADRLEIEWVQADAAALPFPDSHFDCALSAFGAMFASCPATVANELFRVVKPGGTVGMANWTPSSLASQISRMVEDDYLPASSRRRRSKKSSPMAWGDPAIVRARFAGLASEVHFQGMPQPVEFSEPADQAGFLEKNLPALAAVKTIMPAATFRRLIGDLEKLLAKTRYSTNGRGLDEYLVIRAKKALQRPDTSV